MAWTWIAVAAKTIPWRTIVRRAPDIIEAADRLVVARKSTEAVELSTRQTEARLGEVSERLAALEAHDRETAKVVSQLAEQNRDIVQGLEVVAAKLRLIAVLAALAAIGAAAALLVALA